MGVKGIELEEGDVVVGLGVSGDGRDRVLAVCERGYGKQTALEEFRLQSRGGKGVILIDASERNGPVVGVAMVAPGDSVILVTDRGQTLRTDVSQIRETGRNAQGVRLMNVDEGERVMAIEAFAEADSDNGSGNNSTPPPEGTAPDGDATAHGGNGTSESGLN
jgi:DNA gyrase subunit A